MKSKTTLLQVACIVSLLTSIITLCLSIPRSQEFNFDYLGLLVGIQSLIVTILIGWNIYCLVDLKGMRGEQDKNFLSYTILLIEFVTNNSEFT